MVEQVTDVPSLVADICLCITADRFASTWCKVAFPQVRTFEEGRLGGLRQPGRPSTARYVQCRISNSSCPRSAPTTTAGASSAMKCPQVTVRCVRSGAQARHTAAAS